MQPTSLGRNLTGAALTPAAIQAMSDAADELTPTTDIDTSVMEEQKLLYNAEADAVGSVPSPASLKGAVKSGLAALKGRQPAILLDKMGERIAFERAGTRLYDALIIKYRAALQAGGDALPPARPDADGDGEALDEAPADTLARIRAEELSHFDLLCEAMTALGGDPTAQTPCADVGAVASSGLMQVLNDPRTTLAQCLNAMLTAELTDNAGWELLITLADDAGESGLTGRFLAALSEEQEHLVIVKNWLTDIVAAQPQASVA
ncbi:MAG TPA: ferritin-like domain-containing protein [Albitalea sp.]|uniref:ferritin-like domain-containing protein n=1 Tax=Piscinibacter sp. TaxID=1903157 RepID=UPI002ED67090